MSTATLEMWFPPELHARGRRTRSFAYSCSQAMPLTLLVDLASRAAGDNPSVVEADDHVEPRTNRAISFSTTHTWVPIPTSRESASQLRTHAR